MLGTIGVEERIEATVISDVVNAAARIEQFHKIYHCALIISDETYQSIADKKLYSFRIIDKIFVRGKDIPIQLWQVVSAEPSEYQDKLKLIASDYSLGWHYYQQMKFEQALFYFKKCQAQFSEDTVSSILINRCKYFIKNPPSGEWQGVATT